MKSHMLCTYMHAILLFSLIDFHEWMLVLCLKIVFWRTIKICMTYYGSINRCQSNACNTLTIIAIKWTPWLWFLRDHINPENYVNLAKQFRAYVMKLWLHLICPQEPASNNKQDLIILQEYNIKKAKWTILMCLHIRLKDVGIMSGEVIKCSVYWS